MDKIARATAVVHLSMHSQSALARDERARPVPVRRDGIHWLRPNLHGLPRVSLTAAPLIQQG